MAPNYGEESQGPEEERAAGAVHLGHRPRHLLHPDLVGAVRRLPERARGGRTRRRPTRRTTTCNPANVIAGHWVGSILSYLIITGSFACGMAFHNTTARYCVLARPRGPAAPRARQDAPQLQEPAHRLDHPVGHRRADRDRLRRVHRLQRPDQPGLPPALRADGGDGRDHHPGGAGAGLAQHLHLLRASTRSLKGTGGRPGSRRRSRSSPRPSWCTCCSTTSGSSAAGISYANWLGPDRPAGGRSAASASRSTSSHRNREKYESAGRLDQRRAVARQPADGRGACRRSGRQGRHPAAGPALARSSGDSQMGYLIGADIGSQSVKALLLDPDGREVAVGRAGLHDEPSGQRLGRAGSRPVARRAGRRGPPRADRDSGHRRRPRSPIWAWPRRWTASCRSTLSSGRCARRSSGWTGGRRPGRRAGRPSSAPTRIFATHRAERRLLAHRAQADVAARPRAGDLPGGRVVPAGGRLPARLADRDARPGPRQRLVDAALRRQHRRTGTEAMLDAAGIDPGGARPRSGPPPRSPGP